MKDEPTELKILTLRGQIAELGGAIRQLQQSGLDSATAPLLISCKIARNNDPLRDISASNSDPS